MATSGSSYLVHSIRGTMMIRIEPRTEVPSSAVNSIIKMKFSPSEFQLSPRSIGLNLLWILARRLGQESAQAPRSQSCLPWQLSHVLIRPWEPPTITPVLTCDSVHRYPMEKEKKDNNGKIPLHTPPPLNRPSSPHTSHIHSNNAIPLPSPAFSSPFPHPSFPSNHKLPSRATPLPRRKQKHGKTLECYIWGFPVE